MFRVPRFFFNNRVFKATTTALSALAIALAFTVSPVSVQPVEAGKGKVTTKKMSGHKRSGKRAVRTSSRKHYSGNRIASRKLGSGKSRTYVKRRSVFDADNGYVVGRSGISSRQLYHRPARGELRGKKYRRYAGKNRIYSSTLSGGEGLSDGLSRSGVKYVKRKYRGDYGIRRGSGFYEVAGSSGTRIVTRQLNSTVNGSSSNTVNFASSGIIVVGAASHSGLQPVAGGHTGTSETNCEYGTYCTIDLGGPKIITFNDAGDIRNGVLEEELSEEEYIKKYGAK